MQHESVFLLVLPSGAGGCLRCTSVVEARARAKSVTRRGWLFRYITSPQPSERLPGSAVSELELVETFGRPHPAALTRALQHVGRRLSFRFEVTHSRMLPAATLNPASSPEPWTSRTSG
jgi:hypothetical protein